MREIASAMTHKSMHEVKGGARDEVIKAWIVE